MGRRSAVAARGHRGRRGRIGRGRGHRRRSPGGLGVCDVDRTRTHRRRIGPRGSAIIGASRVLGVLGRGHKAAKLARALRGAGLHAWRHRKETRCFFSAPISASRRPIHVHTSPTTIRSPNPSSRPYGGADHRAPKSAPRRPTSHRGCTLNYRLFGLTFLDTLRRCCGALFRVHSVRLFNHKGGVGKTTLTVNLAGGLAPS